MVVLLELIVTGGFGFSSRAQAFSLKTTTNLSVRVCRNRLLALR